MGQDFPVHNLDGFTITVLSGPSWPSKPELVMLMDYVSSCFFSRDVALTGIYLDANS